MVAQGVLGELRPLCLQHFREEEEEAVPLMRKHFTPKEIEKHVVSKVGGLIGLLGCRVGRLLG